MWRLLLVTIQSQEFKRLEGENTKTNVSLNASQTKSNTEEHYIMRVRSTHSIFASSDLMVLIVHQDPSVPVKYIYH